MWMWAKVRDNILQIGQVAMFWIWFGLGLGIANYVEQNLHNPDESSKGKAMRGSLKLFVVYPTAVTATERWPQGLKHLGRFLRCLIDLAREKWRAR